MREAGAKGYLNKIEGTEVIIEAIMTVANGKCYYSRNIEAKINALERSGDVDLKTNTIKKFTHTELRSTG